MLNPALGPPMCVCDTPKTDFDKHLSKSMKLLLLLLMATRGGVIATTDCLASERVSFPDNSPFLSGPLTDIYIAGSPGTATIFVNSPQRGDVTVRVNFANTYNQGLPHSPPAPPKVSWDLVSEVDFIRASYIWIGDQRNDGFWACKEPVMPFSVVLPLDAVSFNVTFSGTELQRAGLKLCAESSFIFVARLESFQLIGELEPTWTLYTQYISWTQITDCSGPMLNFASFSLNYCPCSPPPLPPSPPSPPAPPSPPPPLPPLPCSDSFNVLRNGVPVSSITGDVLYDPAGAIMSRDFMSKNLSVLSSVARLSMKHGYPDAMILDVLLDLPAKTQVYWEIFIDQTYNQTVTYRNDSMGTDTCIGVPSNSRASPQLLLGTPISNLSILLPLADLKALGLRSCVDLNLILVVRIRLPTEGGGGDYFLAWDWGGCNDSGVYMQWPLARLGVFHCPCVPHGPQPCSADKGCSLPVLEPGNPATPSSKPPTKAKSLVALRSPIPLRSSPLPSRAPRTPHPPPPTPHQHPRPALPWQQPTRPPRIRPPPPPQNSSSPPL